MRSHERDEQRPVSCRAYIHAVFSLFRQRFDVGLEVWTFLLDSEFRTFLDVKAALSKPSHSSFVRALGRNKDPGQLTWT